MNRAENKHTIHLVFETPEDFILLNEIKKLTGYGVSKKAIIDALRQFPHFVKKSDFLNDEYIKINRELELVQLKNEVFISKNKLND